MNIDRIVELNRECLLQRSNVGLRKYGVVLGTLSHKEALQHGLEEALDLANYIQTALVNADRTLFLLDKAVATMEYIARNTTDTATRGLCRECINQITEQGHKRGNDENETRS